MKTKTTLVIYLLIALCPFVSGQVTDPEAKLRTLSTDSVDGWKKGGVFGLNLAQASLTNWAAGGQNSFAINGLFSIFANYKRDVTVWDNSLDIGYGVLKQGENSDYIKTDDKFDFLSKYGRRAFSNFYYAALLNFKTQMAEGLDYKTDTSRISDFLAPAYLLGALGMDYKPNSYFSAFIAPLTLKITIVNDQALSDAGAFGVTPGDKSKSEFGGYLRVIYSRNDFTTEFLKNVSFTSKIDLFSNYGNNPQNIDVSWENLIAFNINKYIAVNINTHLLYDDDVDIAIDDDDDGTIEDSEKVPRVQFKEILGVGFTFKF